MDLPHNLWAPVSRLYIQLSAVTREGYLPHLRGKEAIYAIYHIHDSRIYYQIQQIA
jgi:hypothetical protein